jgi:hypothetical protein
MFRYLPKKVGVVKFAEIEVDISFPSKDVIQRIQLQNYWQIKPKSFANCSKKQKTKQDTNPDGETALSGVGRHWPGRIFLVTVAALWRWLQWFAGACKLCHPSGPSMNRKNIKVIPDIMLSNFEFHPCCLLTPVALHSVMVILMDSQQTLRIWGKKKHSLKTNID